MTKCAAYYQFGVKLALWKLGMLGTLETNDNESPKTQGGAFHFYPADELASILRREAMPKDDATGPTPKEEIGAPENPNSTYSGASSGNFGNDLLGRLGVDIRGPESTAI